MVVTQILITRTYLHVWDRDNIINIKVQERAIIYIYTYTHTHKYIYIYIYTYMFPKEC